MGRDCDCYMKQKREPVRYTSTLKTVALIGKQGLCRHPVGIFLVLYLMVKVQALTFDSSASRSIACRADHAPMPDKYTTSSNVTSHLLLSLLRMTRSLLHDEGLITGKNR